MRFRDAALLPDDDDPRLRKRLARLAPIWHSNQGPMPHSAVDFLKGLLESDVHKPPEIYAVNWTTARALVRELSSDQLVADEWNELAGLESSFSREFHASRRASDGLGVFDLVVPNRWRVSEIARRIGRITYGDFEITQKTKNGRAFPVRLRFVWNPEIECWMPLNAMSLASGLKFLW